MTVHSIYNSTGSIEDRAEVGGDSAFRSGAPRPMKMGTTPSQLPYDAGARDTLQSASLRCSAIQHYASWIPRCCGYSAYPSIAVISISLPDRREGPTTDVIIDSAALRRFGYVNSPYEEPFFSCRQGRGIPPPAATGSLSSIHAVSEQHLDAAFSLVRRTGPRSSVPLATRPSPNRFWSLPNQCWPEAFPGLFCCPAWSSLSHSCHRNYANAASSSKSLYCCRLCIVEALILPYRFHPNI